MALDLNLLIVVMVRIIVLGTGAGYLFWKWKRAPRHYVSDYPFLMGFMLAALAVTKVIDLFLLEILITESQEEQLHWHPMMPVGIFRWLLMLAVMGPLLYTNLKIWVPNSPRVRLGSLSGYLALFSIWILNARCFADLILILPWLLLPVAVVTTITFLFIYSQRRLPEVHGLLIGLGWLGYMISTAIRQILMKVPTGSPWGLVIMAELLDLVMWVIIFLGFVIRPRYEQKRGIILPDVKIVETPVASPGNPSLQPGYPLKNS